VNPSIFGQTVTFTATVTPVNSRCQPAPCSSPQTAAASPVHCGNSDEWYSTMRDSWAGNWDERDCGNLFRRQQLQRDHGDVSGGQIVNQATTTTVVTSSGNPSVSSSR